MTSTTHIEYLAGNACLLIRQQGPLCAKAIKSARQRSEPLYSQHCINKALVDYRQADLSRLSLIELDTLAQEFRTDLPECQAMAIVYNGDGSGKQYQHIKNVCEVYAVTTEIFTDYEAAQAWLEQQ